MGVLSHHWSRYNLTLFSKITIHVGNGRKDSLKKYNSLAINNKLHSDHRTLRIGESKNMLASAMHQSYSIVLANLFHTQYIMRPTVRRVSPISYLKDRMLGDITIKRFSRMKFHGRNY